VAAAAVAAAAWAAAAVPILPALVGGVVAAAGGDRLGTGADRPEDGSKRSGITAMTPPSGHEWIELLARQLQLTLGVPTSSTCSAGA